MDKQTVYFERLGKMEGWGNATGYKPTLPILKDSSGDNILTEEEDKVEELKEFYLSKVEGVIVSHGKQDTLLFPSEQLEVTTLGEVIETGSYTTLSQISRYFPVNCQDQEVLKELAEGNDYLFGGIIEPKSKEDEHKS